MSALIVSRETCDGRAAVNTKGEEKGWAALEVFEIDAFNVGEDNIGAGE